MASFTLLSVLGNGSKNFAAHQRFPYLAYQSGSVLVLWDYTKPTGGARRLINMQPGQRCTSLFFSRDAQHLLGVWLSQSCQPILTVWRVAEGTKVAEHRLTDQLGGDSLWADFHAETSHVVLLHGSAATNATVIYWNGETLQPHYVCFGHIGSSHAPIGVRLLDDGCNFLVGEPGALRFWSFTEQTPRLLLKVDLGRPIRAFEVCDRFVYLMPEVGRLRVMNFAGQLEEVSILPPVASCFTAFAIGNSIACVGTRDAALFLYRMPQLELVKRIPSPPELGRGALGSASDMRSTETALVLFNETPQPCPQNGTNHVAIVSISLGMNADYACVCFEDSTYGVVLLESGQYVALRLGHSGIVRCVALAPELRLPPQLASRLLEPERVRLNRAIAFLSVGSDVSGLIAWPRSGPPSRASFLARPLQPRGQNDAELKLDSFAPRRGAWSGGPLCLTAAAFHPVAYLSGDGRLAGSYQLLIGANDGSLLLLGTIDNSPSSLDVSAADAEAAVAQIDWEVTRVRPPAIEVSHGGSGPTLGFSPEAHAQASAVLGHGNGLDSSPVCKHFAFSQCGDFVLASFSSGYVELLRFPLLERLLMVECNKRGGLDGAPEALAKALFVCPPSSVQRSYDQNIYVLSPSGISFSELVLYEVYLLGSSFAKASLREFVLPAIGAFSDFAVHPSQLYLVAVAVLDSASPRPAIFVYDLWNGGLLKRCLIFGSLLITPLAPLQPVVKLDAVGTFIFCASARAVVVGPLDETLLPQRPQWAGKSDSYHADGLDLVTDCISAGQAAASVRPASMAPVLAGSTHDLRVSAAPMPRPGSVICIVDFCTGQQVFQTTAEVNCLTLGSLAHDPAQLLVGSHDGTISIWRPPETVCDRIRAVHDDVRRNAAEQRVQRGEIGEAFTLSEMEEAVAQHWVSNMSPRIDWRAWGDGQANVSNGHEAVGGHLAPRKDQASPWASMDHAMNNNAPCIEKPLVNAPLPRGNSLWDKRALDDKSFGGDVVVRARHDSQLFGTRQPSPPRHSTPQQLLSRSVGRSSHRVPSFPPPAALLPTVPTASGDKPLLDPVSGLEEPQLLPWAPWPSSNATATGSAAVASQQANADAFLGLMGGNDLFDDFSIRAERVKGHRVLHRDSNAAHSIGGVLGHSSGIHGAPLPRWLEKAAASSGVQDGTEEREDHDSATRQSVLEEIARFEQDNEDTQDVASSDEEAQADNGQQIETDPEESD